MPPPRPSEQYLALLERLEELKHEKICLSCWLEIIARWIPNLTCRYLYSQIVFFLILGIDTNPFRGQLTI